MIITEVNTHTRGTVPLNCFMRTQKFSLSTNEYQTLRKDKR